MNVERYEILRKAFPSVRFIQAEEKLNELRAVKDPVELEKLRKACELADFAIDVGIHAIKDGASELAIVAEIEYELKKKVSNKCLSQPPSFPVQRRPLRTVVPI